MKKLSVLVMLSILVSLIVAALFPLTSMAADPPALPLLERGFLLSTTYPSITAGTGQDITFPIDVISKGKSDELVSISVASAPQGWETTLKGGGYGVRTISLLSGKEQSLTFSVKPSANAPAGNNKIVLQAVSADGALKSTLDLAVGIESKPVGGLKLNTMYPQISGPSTGKFQFKVDLINEGDEERTVGLASAQPQDWQVTIKPSYEDKQIASLKLKAGETKGLDVDVTPSSRAEPGEYPIDLQAVSGSLKGTVNMKVSLKGTYDLGVSTTSGRLNAQATAGQPSTVSIIVTNKGSADLTNISFISTKPDGWEVTFSPDKMDSLAAGESREINVTVKPAGKAIAGDYQVSLTSSASGSSASANAQLRVTVETPTLWGWAGIILVVIVIAGLGGLFTRLGRR